MAEIERQKQIKEAADKQDLVRLSRLLKLNESVEVFSSVMQEDESILHTKVQVTKLTEDLEPPMWYTKEQQEAEAQAEDEARAKAQEEWEESQRNGNEEYPADGF
jgi:hypothetical protein